MPPTFSVSTSIAVVPTVPPAPATGVPVLGVPGVLGAPGLAQADAGAADFLDQFKAALKNLTKAVSLPHLAAKMAQHVAAPEQAPGAQAAPAAAQATDSPPVEHQAESLLDVLAALGFVLAPIAFQAPECPDCFDERQTGANRRGDRDVW